jgi:hypothetical protein
MNLETSSEKLILEGFKKFIIESCHLLTSEEFELSVDDTIATYIVNTIKQFYIDYENHKIWLHDRIEPDYGDMDTFVEVIDAYLVGFTGLDRKCIIKWLAELRDELEKLSVVAKSEQKTVQATEKLTNPTSNVKSDEKKITTSKGRSSKSDPHVDILVEMFPQFSLKCIGKVFRKANGDYEKSVDTLMQLEDSKSMSTSSEDEKDNEEEVVYKNDDLTEEERKEIKDRIVKK